MKRILIILISLLILPGCVLVDINVNGSKHRSVEPTAVNSEDSKSIKMSSFLGSAYVSADGIDEFDGDIFSINAFGKARGMEIVSMDLWPLGGVGLGVAGARVTFLPFEFAAGTLFYHPKPSHQLKVFVRSITKGSQAEEVGLQIGDLIVSYGGEKVKSANALIYKVQKRAKIEDKTTVELIVVRTVVEEGKIKAEEISINVKPGILGIYLNEGINVPLPVKFSKQTD